MKRPDNRGNGDPWDLEIQSDRLQAKLFNCLADFGVDLRQESAERPESLATGGLVLRAADQETQISLQTAINGAVKCKSEGRGRRGSRGDTALELALLAKHRGRS